jgi:hypothetical protein
LIAQVELFTNAVVAAPIFFAVPCTLVWISRPPACSTGVTSARAVHAPAGDVLFKPKTSDTAEAERGAKRPTATPPRKCPVCGSSLQGRKASARFCSGRCRAAASRISRARDFEGLLQRMAKAEQALHAAADDLAEYRVTIEVKIGRAVQ